jgi:cation transport ATPase
MQLLFWHVSLGLQQQGKTAVCVSVDGTIRAVYGIADAVRPESKQVTRHATATECDARNKA